MQIEVKKDLELLFAFPDIKVGDKDKVDLTLLIEAYIENCLDLLDVNQSAVCVIEIPSKKYLEHIEDKNFVNDHEVVKEITETHPSILSVRKNESGTIDVMIDDSRYGPTYLLFYQKLQAIAEKRKDLKLNVVGRYDPIVRNNEKHNSMYSLFNGLYNSHISVANLLEFYIRDRVSSQIDFVQNAIKKNKLTDIWTEEQILRIADNLPIIVDRNIHSFVKGKFIKRITNGKKAKIQDYVENYLKQLNKNDVVEICQEYDSFVKSKSSVNAKKKLQNESVVKETKETNDKSLVDILVKHIVSGGIENNTHPLYKLVAMITEEIVKSEKFLIDNSEEHKKENANRLVYYPLDKEFDGINPTNEFISKSKEKEFREDYKRFDVSSDKFIIAIREKLEERKKSIQ